MRYLATMKVRQDVPVVVEAVTVEHTMPTVIQLRMLLRMRQRSSPHWLRKWLGARGAPSWHAAASRRCSGLVTPPGSLLCRRGAPGADEDAQVKPFVGAAGKLLTKIIIAMGLTRNDVYICNVLKCRPPGNRTPAPDEVSQCRGYLDRQLDILKPNTSVRLGSGRGQEP